MTKAFLAILRIAAVLLVTLLISHSSETILALFHHGSEAFLTTTFFSIALIFSLSFGIFYLSRSTPIPNFVIAIFFGMAAAPLLAPITHQHSLLGILVGIGATFILFGGGLETPFTNFRRLLPKISLLSFVGLTITALLFSLVLGWLAEPLRTPLSLTTTLLLGAVLASTDPAAIIPVLKRLRFKSPDTKDIVISESAVTDVTGTLLTVALLTALSGGFLVSSVFDGYTLLFTTETLILFIKQLLFGVGFGVLGFYLLEVLTHFKVNHGREYEADSAFFLVVPILVFTLALSFGGSGYLAAFVAGLLFHLKEHLHETERFFNHLIDGFFKPMIFLLLGALVEPKALITYAPIGIAAALLFMIVIRPIAVFLCLTPFCLIGKTRMTWNELWFISFVRETGAIPAVLLVTLSSLQLPHTEGLLSVGMWVILATLIVSPALTPLVAKHLGVADDIPETVPQTNGSDLSYIVLCTRGNSWQKRLPHVVDWAVRHHVPKVVLMLSLEYEYKPALEQTISDTAHHLMRELNEKLVYNGEKMREFKFFSSTGFLQENIEYLSKNDPHVVAIFIGRGMLDYRLDEIKKLCTPLCFLP